MRYMVIASALMLAGCASEPPKTIQQVKQDASLEGVPGWFLKPPNEDSNYYGRGVASSTDLQFAIDKATMAAQRDIATHVDGTMSGVLKDFFQETGNKTVSETSRVSRAVLRDVSLSGYSVTETKVLAEAGTFRAYVLVRYPQTTKVATADAYREMDTQLREVTRAAEPRKVVAFPTGMVPVTTETKTVVETKSSNEPPLPAAAPRVPVEVVPDL